MRKVKKGWSKSILGEELGKEMKGGKRGRNVRKKDRKESR